MEVSIDKAGRVVIPKAIRDDLQLDPGDVLDLEREGETLQLRPRRNTGAVRKEDGIWVYRSPAHGAPADTEALLRRAREDRIQDLMK